MKKNITNREDLFLAKIAGYDVDVKTLTPPTASNVREKILLDIAEKVSNQGDDKSSEPLNVTATPYVDEQTQKPAISTNLTAETAYEAISTNRIIIATAQLPIEDTFVTAKSVLPLYAKKYEVYDDDTGDTIVMYAFNFIDMDLSDGPEMYCTDSLRPSDNIVFHLISN